MDDREPNENFPADQRAGAVSASGKALDRSIGDVIRERSLKDNLTIAEVAAQAGILRGMVSKSENGQVSTMLKGKIEYCHGQQTYVLEPGDSLTFPGDIPHGPERRIERARNAGVPALIELLTALFAIETDFSADRARQRRGLELLLAQPDDRAVLLVARLNDGVAVGMASAQLVISTAEGAPSAWIEDVIVQQALRGHGIARLLLRGLLDWAQRHGATRAQLLADNSNTSALDFYSRSGWQPKQLSACGRSLRNC